MLIAVPRNKVIEAVRPQSDGYVLITVWPYNCFFTNRIDVIPLADPGDVIHELDNRLAGLAKVDCWEWCKQDREQAAQMCVWITEDANPIVS